MTAQILNPSVNQLLPNQAMFSVFSKPIWNAKYSGKKLLMHPAQMDIIK